MAGSTTQYAMIRTNLLIELGIQLKGKRAPDQQ